jgi:signal transduction histidine kinase
VRVHLRWQPGEVRVQVRNAPPSRPARRKPEPGGGGVGLTGLAERVSSVGGELTAGPDLDGGFTVQATIPLGRRAAAGSDVAAQDLRVGAGHR